MSADSGVYYQTVEDLARAEGELQGAVSIDLSLPLEVTDTAGEEHHAAQGQRRLLGAGICGRTAPSCSGTRRPTMACPAS